MAETHDADALRIAGELTAIYRHINATAMADMPLCNDALDVAAVDFRVSGGRAFGIMLTPWFMNLVSVPLGEVDEVAPGFEVSLGLPAGTVAFTRGDLDGFGRIDSCSLFSPVFEFEDMEAALATANAAMTAFFDATALEEPPPPPKPAPVLDRRALFARRPPPAGEAQP